MKIIIIGGCGYVGSALFSHLTDIGHDVETIDIEERGNRNSGVNTATACAATRAFDFEGADAVIWVAGRSSVKRALADPLRALRENVTELADLTRRLSGQPLLWASSASVLSRPQGGVSNVYDTTKIAAEMLIPVVYPNAYALRFGTVCGAAPNLRPDMVMNAMVRAALDGGIVDVTNEDASRPILGVHDLCTAVESLLAGNDAPGEYNLVSFNARIERLANFIAMRTGPTTLVRHFPPLPTYDFTMEPAAIPGWTPVETMASIYDGLVELHKETPIGSFAP